MKTTEYLYGIKPTEFAVLPYKKAIEFKVEAARQLLYKLLYDFHYEIRDDTRINKVHAAIKFNKELLKELK